MNRREFVTASAISFSCAASSRIFFPKPAQAFNLKVLLSNATVQNIFSDLVRYAAIRVIDRVTAPPPIEIQRRIDQMDTRFVEKGFTKNRTPLAKTALQDTLWGNQKDEILGPNAVFPNSGFAMIQPSHTNDFNEMIFSGPTSIAIDNATKVLADEKVQPPKVQAMLLPWREHVADWGTLQGDRDPNLGNLNVSFTEYETRSGWVSRHYELLEPGLGGRGRIVTRIRANGEPMRTITTDVIIA